MLVYTHPDINENMRSILRLIIILPALSVHSCEKYADPLIPDNSFYFNSFESTSDTAGWYGISTDHRIEDAPAVGGRYSIQISGGCVIPHARYIFSPLAESLDLVLKCWGKNLSNGGSVNLYTMDYSKAAHISVSESSWTRYQCEDTLHCSKGDTLVLDLISGGFLPSAILIDQLEIMELE